MLNVRRNYLRDIAHVFSGNALSQLIGLAALPFLTRLYSPSDFALQNLFVQTIGFATIVSSWRYEYLMVSTSSELLAAGLQRLVVTLSILMMLIATPAIYFWSDSLANALGNDAIAPFLTLAPLAATLTSIGIAMQGRAQRNLLYKISSMSEVLSRSAYVAIALCGAKLFNGAWGLILGSIFSASTKIAFFIYSTTAYSEWNFRVPWVEFKKGKIWIAGKTYWRLAGSMSFSHFLMSATGLIPVVFIGRIYGSAILGQYSLVLATLFLPSALIGNAIGQVYYQRAASAWSQGMGFKGLWVNTARMQAWIGVPLFFIGALISPWLYPAIFGFQWHLSGNMAVLMMPAAFFSFLSSPLDRGCLVVNAWRYVVLWHAFRVTTTTFVSFLAYWFNLTIEAYLLVLSIQMSACYLVDFIAGWRFSKSLPKSTDILAKGVGS
ncbi:MAG: oligosaccharide flippase family protein [Pseudomonadota bacterium]